MNQKQKAKEDRLREKQRAITLLLSLLFIFVDKIGTAAAAI